MSERGELKLGERIAFSPWRKRGALVFLNISESKSLINHTELSCSLHLFRGLIHWISFADITVFHLAQLIIVSFLLRVSENVWEKVWCYKIHDERKWLWECFFLESQNWIFGCTRHLHGKSAKDHNARVTHLKGYCFASLFLRCSWQLLYEFACLLVTSLWHNILCESSGLISF